MAFARESGLGAAGSWTRVAACALAVSSGCADPPASEPPLPAASTVSLEPVGEGAVSGTIDGEAFTTVDARFRVVTREGRERIDLLFADRAIERCGLPIEREETLVWMRFPGRVLLEPGTYELLTEGETDSAEAAALEVHWERPHGAGLDRRIREGHRGVARVEIEEAAPTRLTGRLRICFAGTDEACVSGRFEAAPCWSRIEGRTVREPPGLDDEALEPRPRAAP